MSRRPGDDDLSVGTEARPLALDAPQAPADVEREIGTTCSLAGFHTGTPSRLAASRISSSAMLPLTSESSTNVCSHERRTEKRR
jgi:hypothetical protein